MSCICDLYRRFGARKVWFTRVNQDCPDHGHLISIAEASDANTVEARIEHLGNAIKKIGEEFERLKDSIKKSEEDAAGNARERDTKNND